MIIRRFEKIPERMPVTEAARILNLSRMHVYNLLNNGDLECERLGPKATVVLRDSLVRWLRQRGAAVTVDAGGTLTIIQAPFRLNLEQLAVLCRRWHITSLSFFGSVLRDDFQPDSDIDVLVTFAPEARLSLFDLASIANELEDLFGREVDLVERRWIEESHNPIRRRDILTTAQEVYHAAA